MNLNVIGHGPPGSHGWIGLHSQLPGEYLGSQPGTTMVPAMAAAPAAKAEPARRTPRCRCHRPRRPAAPRPNQRGPARCPTGPGRRQSTAAPGGPSAPQRHGSAATRPLAQVPLEPASSGGSITPTHGNWKPPRRSVHLAHGMVVHTNRRTGGNPAMERGCPGDPRCTHSTTEAPEAQSFPLAPLSNQLLKVSAELHPRGGMDHLVPGVGSKACSQLAHGKTGSLPAQKRTVSPRVPPSKRENKRYFGQVT